MTCRDRLGDGIAGFREVGCFLCLHVEVGGDRLGLPGRSHMDFGFVLVLRVVLEGLLHSLGRDKS